MNSLQVITFLYILFNSGRVFSYVPQIISVYKENSPVMAISLLTWTFWTAANFTTGIYTSVVTPDFLLAIVSFGNALCCLIVVLQVLYKRYKFGYMTFGMKPSIALPLQSNAQDLNSNHISFTEVPTVDVEDVYHLFHISDDKHENHQVILEKKMVHEPIEDFDFFLQMIKSSEDSVNQETTQELTPILPTEPTESLEPLEHNIVAKKTRKKSTRKNKNDIS